MSGRVQRFFWRLRGGWRCKIGVHRLRGYRDCGDGVNVAPFNPRGRPLFGCFRKCEWCGARWGVADDGGLRFVWARRLTSADSDLGSLPASSGSSDSAGSSRSGRETR